MRVEPLYSFPARLESLGAMAALLQSKAPACEAGTLLRAETALEELLTNSIVHGRAAAKPSATIWLGAHGDDAMLHVRYEDASAAFDPIARIDEALLRNAGTLEQRAQGGLGLLMVFRLADAFRYRHDHGRNRIDLAFTGRAIGTQQDGQTRARSVDFGA